MIKASTTENIKKKILGKEMFCQFLCHSTVRMLPYKNYWPLCLFSNTPEWSKKQHINYTGCNYKQVKLCDLTPDKWLDGNKSSGWSFQTMYSKYTLTRPRPLCYTYDRTTHKVTIETHMPYNCTTGLYSIFEFQKKV